MLHSARDVHHDCAPCIKRCAVCDASIFNAKMHVATKLQVSLVVCRIARFVVDFLSDIKAANCFRQDVVISACCPASSLTCTMSQ